MQQAGATLHRGAWASPCSGFSLRSPASRALGFSACGAVVGSCGSWTLEHRLSSCGPWAKRYSTWHLLGPGSPSLEGEFLSTVPPAIVLDSFISQKRDFQERLHVFIHGRYLIEAAFLPVCLQWSLVCFVMLFLRKTCSKNRAR